MTKNISILGALKTKQIILLILAVFLLIWPVVVDQDAFARFLAPEDGGTSANPLVFGVKILSLFAGGMIGATLASASRKLPSWQLWTLRIIVALLITGIFYYVTFLYDFSRDFTF